MEKFFKHDRLARQALPLFAPEARASDLSDIRAGTIGPRVAELGDSLYNNGSLPGWPSWDPEDSLEIVKSIEIFKEALKVFSAIDWNRMVQEAARKAEAGYLQMGKLVTKISAMRWAVGLKWIAARTAVVAKTAIGGGLGTIDAKLSQEAMYGVKLTLFNWLKEICADSAVLAMFDHDLLGHGVWHSGGREPLPEEASDHWYRRGAIFDLAMLCLQATRLPPEEMNRDQPLIELLKPFGQDNWRMPPYEAPKFILDMHGWTADAAQAPFSDMPAKPLRMGWVLHMNTPAEFEHDFGDAAIIEKVQRGEELGKGTQEDHLPGAIHGSVGLLYAVICAKESYDHVRFYPDVLVLEGFVAAFLRYGPPLLSLDFSHCPGLITDELLQLVPLAGNSIKILDFEGCELDDDRMGDMLLSLEHLQTIDYLDLADNLITAAGAEMLLEGLCEMVPCQDHPKGERRRADLSSLRLDRNPLGDGTEFTLTVARILGERGNQVSGGGSLTLQLGDGATSFDPNPREGTFAKEMLETGEMVDAVSLKDLRVHADKRLRALNKRAEQDPVWAAKAGPRDWLAARRAYHEGVLNSPIMQFWRRNVVPANKLAAAEGEPGPAAEGEPGSAAATLDPRQAPIGAQDNAPRPAAG